MSDSCRLVTHQAPLSMGIPRQEYWSGLPCPPPRDLPSPGIEPRSPALQADSLPAEPPGKPIFTWIRQAFLVAHGILSCSRWDLLPWSRIALRLAILEHWVLAPGPGKPQVLTYLSLLYFYLVSINNSSSTGRKVVEGEKFRIVLNNWWLPLSLK